MTTQVFRIQNKLNNLHDEILAARPDLKDSIIIESIADSMLDENLIAARPYLKSVDTSDGIGETVVITLPDKSDDSFIASIVTAHKATEPSMAEAIEVQRKDDITALQQYLSTWDTLDGKQKDDALLRILRFVLSAS